jgi:hypothetical protein
MIASSYPLLDAFWTILWLVGFFVWIWLVIVVFADIIRSHDMSGWGKALWTLGIIIFPLMGVLLYLIIRGGGMHQRQAQQAQAANAAMRDYIRQTAGGSTTGTADELAKLADLRDRGVINDDEFQREKAKALGS